jgi:MFS family permease
MTSSEHVQDIAVADDASARSSAALTLVSLAHGINHAQGALQPLVFPLVLRDLNFGYGELGIMLGVASAVGGLLQLGAGALGRILPRHQILGVGNASVGVCFVFVGLAQSYFQFFFWTVMSRVGGAAQHPVGASLLSHHFKKRKLGTALATHFTAGNIGTAMIPALGASYAGVAIASLILGVTAFATHPILQTLIAHTTSGGNRDTGFAWFYTATFLAGAFWSPAVGYLSDWWGLTAAFGAMAISFVAAIVCVLFGRFDQISTHQRGSVSASSHN